jgi:hypothetical protein
MTESHRMQHQVISFPPLRRSMQHQVISPGVKCCCMQHRVQSHHMQHQVILYTSSSATDRTLGLWMGDGEAARG